jgi:hypothetical protein
VEKFVKEGGAKAGARKAEDQPAAGTAGTKKDKETAARTGGYDEQQVSNIRAVT